MSRVCIKNHDLLQNGDIGTSGTLKYYTIGPEERSETKEERLTIIIRVTKDIFVTLYNDNIMAE
ncbi:MAG TPA: hypothetical protein VE089_00330 [Nitrososphaeraceae archaeon]|nr:hypothetical protein [Nitrososphaeraceae archaeon]